MISHAVYFVALPIGNREDITRRALDVLGDVDTICCEDTRHTAPLLAHYGIRKPLLSLHEHNERERAGQVADRAEAGERFAVVSDAGMPGVSGRLLLRLPRAGRSERRRVHSCPEQRSFGSALQPPMSSTISPFIGCRANCSASSAAVPRWNCSCTLVSSRATQTCTSGCISASSFNVPAMR